MDLLEKASQIIRGGEVVVVATETFYCLAADPFNSSAVDKIYRIKARSRSKPLPLIAADVDTVVKRIRKPHPRLLRLINNFWPGSLTIVMSLDLRLASGVMNPDGKIAARVPPPCPARTCAALSGGWVTATSANVSGGLPPDRIASVPQQIQRQAAMILDNDPTPGKKPSTIIEVLDDGQLILVREGAVSFDLVTAFSKRLTEV